MKTIGIRILDSKDNYVYVKLTDILEEINNGNLFHWSILYLEADGDFEDVISTHICEEQIRVSEKGFFITWEELNVLSKNFDQVIDIVLLGCKDENLLHRYENDQEKYETCDITIEMVDSCYWEVFSKDESLINRLAAKFKEIKFLEPDFEK